MESIRLFFLFAAEMIGSVKIDSHFFQLITCAVRIVMSKWAMDIHFPY